MSPRADFTHVVKRVGNLLMIESTRANCGVMELVSHHDGTLAEWEEGHTCKNGQLESRPEGDQKQGGSQGSSPMPAQVCWLDPKFNFLHNCSAALRLPLFLREFGLHLEKQFDISL